MLDALARIDEPGLHVTFPLSDDYYKEAWADERAKRRYKYKEPKPETTWMAM